MRLLAAAAVALAFAAPAQAGRYAVGLEPGASAERVTARVEHATGGAVSRRLLALGALTLETREPRGVASLPGVAYVERLDAPRRLAFAPTDPLAAKQWYLSQIRAFDSWAEPPPLAGPLVAVIDSGIDADHPDLRDRIVEARSFVPGKSMSDQLGHGTFVAGVIAARHNGQGTVGIAFPSELLVAKVVGADRSIHLEAEVEAIRWAVDSGARVINLSLGGLRDPLDPSRDTFSRLEASAIAYAHRKGVLVVAAVGNADQAPRRPWPFANYPAALPHVLGVAALARDGSVPTFSNRDPIFNDLAAPGQDIVSTFPRQLTALRPSCVDQGYSTCGTDEYRPAEGTSFAAPQISAAAALLLAVRPELTGDQVAYLLTRSAVDANASTGCKFCPLQRDTYAGWGRLDVAAAVAQASAGPLPPVDSRETNDDAGALAAPLWGRTPRVEATIDYWDDQSDVYRLRLFPGQRVFAALRGPAGTKVFLWQPGTRRVEGLSLDVQRMLVARSVQRGAAQRISYRVPPRAGGFYYLHVKIESPGSGAYTLSLAKSER